MSAAGFRETRGRPGRSARLIHPTARVPPLPDLRFAGSTPRAIGLEGPRLPTWRPGGGGATALPARIGANRGLALPLAALSRHARIIAWNAPGYVLSDGFRADAPKPEDYAAVALALLEALGVRGKVLLAGSSFGSMLAACLAATHPGRVARLALLGTSRGQRWKGEAGRAAMLTMREASIAGGAVAMARARSSGLVAPGTAPEVLSLVERVVAATNTRGYLQAARCTDAVDVVEDYAPRIACPTLAVTGAADAVNPPEVGCAIAAAIPCCRFVSPPGLGHLPELEAPALTLDLLRTHLLGS
jgi:pimeloyl-ACP methyl ester carboxylesterase